MKSSLIAVAAIVLISLQAQTVQYTANHPPRFEDFPVAEVWKGPPTPLKLTTSSERMFKTRLTEAVKQPADFAGHYRMAYWGCGSVCAPAALIDLRTGDAYQPPLAAPQCNRLGSLD